MTKILTGAALALACATATAAPAPASATSIADCDGPFATVLQAGAASDARAYWLDRRLIQWPAAGTDASDGVFKLYYSATAQVRATTGARVTGADGALLLAAATAPAPAGLAARFKFIGKGPLLAVAAPDAARIPDLLTGQLLLVREAADGTVLDATTAQLPGALDDLYASAANTANLGVTVDAKAARFKLWAPTAQRVAVCSYATGSAKAAAITTMARDAATGIEAFSFGDPTPVLEHADILDCLDAGSGRRRGRW